MSKFLRSSYVLSVASILAVSWCQHGWAQQIDAEAEKFFESKIRPVLVRECYGCHSTKTEVKGGLWLDTRDGALEGGDSGPAIVAGDLDESLLWNAINHLDFEMPPGKKLPDDVISDFKAWIKMGAPDPRVQEIQKINSTITAADIERGKAFWSFKAPQKTPIPTNGQSTWPTTAIDQFVLANLHLHELEPSDDADPNTFLRRLSFDLIGLPPSPKQIAWFNRQWKKDPDAAIESVVDSLLARPEFGERWGRHWLDVARYAESTGKEQNLTYPQAWRYRDYVIDSFNEDKPYDRFIQEQIAGDLLPVKTDEQWAQNLVATGFLALGPKTLIEKNARQFQLDLIDEQIDVTTRVVLGVSIACARCHDHKFDPIPQRDYYALSGIFKSMTTHYGTLDSFQNRRASNLIMLPVEDLSPFDKPLSQEQLAQLKQELQQKKNDVAAARREQLQARARKDATTNTQKRVANALRLSAEVGNLESVINSYDKSGKPITYCMGVQPTEQPVNARMLVRGEFDKPADEVPRGFPRVLTDERDEINANSSGRLELARWMTADTNPLAARVMVNRVWLHMFGNGIVRTPENFGATGLPPTNPELLDHLAIEFMENGWSIKTLVRQIATSHVYRTNSQFNKRNFEADPENKYLWRMEPRRLDAEVIRDSILQISGDLDHNRPRGSIVAAAGSAIVRDGVLVAPGSLSGRSNTMASMSNDAVMRNSKQLRDRMQSNRNSNVLSPSIVRIDQPVKYRSVYLPIVRDNVPRALDVFDFAESTLVVGQRETSNTPDQGLYFLNNEFVIDQCDAMARRLMQETELVEEQVSLAFQLAFGRNPTAKERKAVIKFYDQFETSSDSLFNRIRYQNAQVQKLSAVCQAIIASAEFRFVN